MTHIGVDQYDIHNHKENYDDDDTVDDINDYQSGYCAEKESVYNGLTAEEEEELEESWKERVKMMATESKPNFDNTWQRLTKLGQLIWS